MKRTLPPPGTFLLLCATIVVGGLAWQSMTAPEIKMLPQLPEIEASDPTKETVAAAPLRPERSAEFYAAITQRPLFFESRRPLDPDSEVAAEQPTDDLPQADASPEPARAPIAPPNVRLRGLMLNGEMRAALIEQVSGSAEWYAQGVDIDGWTVVEIAPDSVTLKNADVTHQLELYSVSRTTEGERGRGVFE